MPVVDQLFSMEKGPFEHKLNCSTRETPLNDPKIGNRKGRPVTGIFGVKMGMAMLFVILCNDNPKKSADFRHNVLTPTMIIKRLYEHFNIATAIKTLSCAQKPFSA
jgi:hypothetical protein